MITYSKEFRHSNDFFYMDKSENLNPTTISDSVIFNLSASYQFSSFLEIPVYFRSASVINSVDFAIRYDEQQIVLDSVIVPDSTIQYLYYYNQQDSTFRFTSNCLTPIVSDSTLLILRFDVISSPVCSNEFQNVTAWLNGDACNSIVTNCVLSQINELQPKIELIIYPNPVMDFLNVTSSADGIFELKSGIGNTIKTFKIFKSETVSIFTSELNAGIYFYQFSYNNSLFSGKLIIAK